MSGIILDNNGEVMPFGFTKLSDSGQFKGTRGQIPDGYDIPQTGDWSNVAVSDIDSIATGISLPVDTTGKMRVDGIYRKWNYNSNGVDLSIRGCRLNCQIRGASSQDTSGETERNFFFGLGTTANQYFYIGIEALSDGTANLVIRKGFGVHTRKEVDFNLLDPDKVYNITVWIVRTSTGVDVAVGEREQVFCIESFDDSEVDLARTYAPTIEWFQSTRLREARLPFFKGANKLAQSFTFR